MVLGELVDLMTEMAPRMREFGTSLRNTDTTLTDEVYNIKRMLCV
jgi:hypothetical protein